MVLVNTAIAIVADPAKMAEAFKLAVIAGRMAILSRLGKSSNYAMPSSPLTSLCMNSFSDVFGLYDCDTINTRIIAKTGGDVEHALASDGGDIDDFMALRSPAAKTYLEQIASKSQ